jgi:hypothetical protein
MLGEQLNLHKQFEEADLKRQAEEKLKDEIELLDIKTVYDLIEAGKLNTLEDFVPFKKQIDFYKKRYQEFNQRHKDAPAGLEKEKIHWLKVNPDSLDEERYRGLALLFIRYQEVATGKAKKIVSKPAQKENLPTSKHVENITEDYEDKDDDRPDPYGEIYPLSLKWRKKRR